MIKLVAFDWNGTLLSDTNITWRGGNLELKACRTRPISMARFKETFTVPIVETLVKNGADREFCLKNSVMLSNVFHNFYESHADKCRTRGGVREILAWLHKNKIITSIYSNHTLTGINKQLKRLVLSHYMGVVLAHTVIDGAMNNKNKGERLFEYLKRHKLKPNEIISIGDTDEEIEIGKKYGYHTVAITGGYNSTARLKKHHPDFLIHNMLELKKIIKKLNNITDKH